jgi:hypothetical protein
MSFLTRIKKKLGVAGEEFTVGGNTYRGTFKIIDSGTLRNYLDDVELMGVTKPGLLLITDADASISPTNTITRDGRTYEVLKTSTHRIGGVAVVKVAILA